MREMFFILLFSTATFWLTALFLLGSQTTRVLGYPALLFSTVRTGELFIFTVGFLGPILLLTSDDPKEARVFPSRLWSVAALLIIGLIAAGYHSQIKAAQFKGALDPSDADFFYTVSLSVAVAAVVLRYLSMVYRRSTFVPQVEIKKPTDEFADNFEQRHPKDGSAPSDQMREAKGDLPHEDFAEAFEQREAEKSK